MDPEVRFGKPCLAGTRIDAAMIVAAVGNGETIEQIGEEYRLSREQIRAAVRYAAHVAAHLPPAVAKAS